MANRISATNGNPGPLPAPARPAPRAPGPALSVIETAEAYVVTADVPGLSAGDLDLSWTPGGLVLRGLQRAPALAEGERALVDERRHGPFERVVSFEAPVDGDRVEAHLEHGVLTLRAPKAPSGRPRRIEVRRA